MEKEDISIPRLLQTDHSDLEEKRQEEAKTHSLLLMVYYEQTPAEAVQDIESPEDVDEEKYLSAALEGGCDLSGHPEARIPRKKRRQLKQKLEKKSPTLRKQMRQ